MLRKYKNSSDQQIWVGNVSHAYCFARNMLKEAGAIFTLRHEFKTSGGSREQLWEKTLPIQDGIRDYCEIFLCSKDALVRTRAKKTLANWDHLFTFLKYEGVEPNNNRAEQELRPAVQWRKICFGSQSSNGLRFTERLSTGIGTCRINGINLFPFCSTRSVPAFQVSYCSNPTALPAEQNLPKFKDSNWFGPSSFDDLGEPLPEIH